MFVCQSHTNPQLYHGFLMIISISIYQISGQQFSHVLIGSRNLEYPWIFTVLRTERKMACHLANVSKEEILAISETAFFYPSDLVNTKTTIPFRVGEEQWINIGHFGKYHNTLCLSPKILHRHCFQFLLGLAVVPRENKNNAYVKFGGTRKVYYGIFRNGLYLDASRLGIYPPLFTSPSGDSCIIVIGPSGVQFRE